MMLQQAEELIQIIDNLEKKEKKVIIQHVWTKYILGLLNSDNTDNEIVIKIEAIKENHRKIIIKFVYLNFILPNLNLYESIGDAYEAEDYI